MNTQMKSSKILRVNFPETAAIFNDNEKHHAAELTRGETRHSGWDVRRDMARGTKSDTGQNIKKDTSLDAMHDTGYNFLVYLSDLIRHYAPTMDNNATNDQSLLPPVASL